MEEKESKTGGEKREKREIALQISNTSNIWMKDPLEKKK